ncbi:hypothetical protein ColLi_03094 [Colletotrichum liriopes]|uniref:BTB domain-containing protein n=1 Tax=Colletotrichum liriopes TaxID=708192 RepID=A0AA37GH14_9PEZI|nr:hypothetical protein ColLi_03094 [Colletotrichum liriopes]
MVVNAKVLVSPWRCEVSSADDPRPHSAATAARQSTMLDSYYSKELSEACSLPVKAGISSSKNSESTFTTPMSKNKFSGKVTAYPGSSGTRKSRRGRLSALFGRGSENTAQYSAASKKEVESMKNDFANSFEQDQQLQKPTVTSENDYKNEMAQDSKSAGGKKTLEVDTNSSINMTTTVNFAEASKSSVITKGSGDQMAVSQTFSNDSTFDVTQQTLSSLLTPSRDMKQPVRRHKRASSSFKIVDKDTADAVLLPALSYTQLHSPNKNHDSIHSKKNAGANGDIQADLSDQTLEVDHKQFVEAQLPRSTSCTTISSSNDNHTKAAHSDKTTAEDTHLLPSATYSPPETLYSIPEASQNNLILIEDGLLSSASYNQPGPTCNISHACEADVEGNRLPSSTSYATSGPLHGMVKTPVSDKTLPDKKVRFAVASSSKAVKGEDDGRDSDDSDKTIKPGIGGMKAAPETILSPVIWGKESEPKIWLKDGKPTLFQPKKDPSYYTNPLWSRQYPEILSNDPRVNPHATAYSERTTSTDGRQYNKTPAANSNNTNCNIGANLHMNTDCNTNMSVDAGTPTLVLHSREPLETFVGRDFPEQANTPAGLALTPRYRAQVKIEVGGRRFISTFEILEKSPWFRQLFSVDFRNWYHDGVFHIDNDGDLFAHILRYLRTDLYPLFWDTHNGFDYAMYAMVKQQAHHYMLYDLEAWIMAQKFHDVVETQVVHQKVVIPHDQAWIHEQRLVGNHSYVVSGVVDHASPRISLKHDEQAAATCYYQSDYGNNPGSKGKAKDIKALDVNIGGAVAVFTTEKTVKVDMDQLRRF